MLIISPPFPSATLTTPFPRPLDIIALLMNVLRRLLLLLESAITVTNETSVMIFHASSTIAIAKIALVIQARWYKI